MKHFQSTRQESNKKGGNVEEKQVNLSEKETREPVALLPALTEDECEYLPLFCMTYGITSFDFSIAYPNW